MSPTFCPEDFFETAKELKDKRFPTEADLRTAVGRAYYAAYGAAKARYLAAQAPGNREIRHGEVGSIIMGVVPGPVIAKTWDALMRMRKTSDYVYDQPVTKQDARSALDHSDILLTAIRQADDASFKKISI
ncbi:hypothetical protein [Candidatus Palauibacter sp.]|uniref:hypothetical protein n=1 Tax=Candidatus Palauibacter sp. TaxID=3101350 RepID=UPI003B01059A